MEVPGDRNEKCDLAIIEFDDHGILWKVEQLRDAIDLISQRNEDAERGILVVVYVHGWKNNANPDQGDLTRFREKIIRIASEEYRSGPTSPDRVVGIYLGWRGATTRVPFYKELTFWARRIAAERVASLNMRETLFRVMTTTKRRSESKCFIIGHSMGGIIVGKTLAPSLTTLMVSADHQEFRVPADLVVLANPALDALSTWQFVDFLKRTKARLEIRSANGERRSAPGPIVVSFTSEADSATGRAYPIGEQSVVFLRSPHSGVNRIPCGRASVTWRLMQKAMSTIWSAIGRGLRVENSAGSGSRCLQ